MNFRRRRRINWLSVISILIGIIGIGSLLYPRLGIEDRIEEQIEKLSLFPKPTPTVTPTIDSGATILSRADALFTEGKLDQSAETYAQAVTIAEQAYSDFLYLAERLESAGSATEAAARRQDATQALQRAASGYTRWCKILALRGKAEDAISRCNRAIDINNRSAEAYAFLALAYDRNGELDKAIAAGLRAIDLEPNMAEGYAFLAEAYADKSPFEKRNMETAQKAVSVDSKSAFAYRNLGWVYETEGNYRQAAFSYISATQLMPTLSYFYLDLCRAQKIRELIDEALVACQKAIELDAQNPETYDRLGQLYLDRFENQKALVQFQKAVEVDPSYALGYAHQGWVYYSSMRAWEKAATAFAKALELGGSRFSPGQAAEFYNVLGWSYYRLGRCTEARQQFDLALSLLARARGAGLAELTQQSLEGLAACEGKK
jgi:tetratricopeptide (TPR) repeat protein